LKGGVKEKVNAELSNPLSQPNPIFSEFHSKAFQGKLNVQEPLEVDVDDDVVDEFEIANADKWEFHNPFLKEKYMGYYRNGVLSRQHLASQIQVVISDEAHLQTNELNDGARALDYLVGAGSKLLLMSGTPM